MYKILYVNEVPSGYAYDVDGEYTQEQANNIMKYGSVVPTQEAIDALEAETATFRERAEAKKYLANTDWYVTRLTETGTAIPEEVLVARADARIKADGGN